MCTPGCENEDGSEKKRYGGGGVRVKEEVKK
jgi:hypothetical protein